MSASARNVRLPMASALPLKKAGPRHVPAGRSKTNYSIWLFVWKGRSVMDKIVAGSSELGPRKNGHGRNVMSRWKITGSDDGPGRGCAA
jgi:hypothetical protein